MPISYAWAMGKSKLLQRNYISKIKDANFNFIYDVDNPGYIFYFVGVHP